MVNPTGGFSPETTRAALDAACSRAGLDPTGATLLRFGENAIYRLATAPLVARVGRSVQASHRETDVARWLESNRLPAVRLAPVDQPVVADVWPVTFWEFIVESEPAATSAELGAALRNLHALPVPTDFVLPTFVPMPKVEKRLRAIGDGLPRVDSEFLRERKRELEVEFEKLDFSLGFGPIHGDAHAANLMRDADGVVRLIDFEDFAWGPREWDVCIEAVRYSAFGWVSESNYRAYVDAYQFDPLEWSGLTTIRAIRELNMTTWLAQQIGQSEDVDSEVRKRISDLRDVQAPRRWSVR